MQVTPDPQPAFKGVWIPEQIWRDTTLSWFEKCLLAEIEFLDDGKGCWASNEHLAKMMGTKKDSLKVTIHHLKKAGWIMEMDVEKDGPKRRLKVSRGYLPLTDWLTTVNRRLTTVNRFPPQNGENYSVKPSDLLGFDVQEILVEIPNEVPPKVPQKKSEFPEQVRDVAARFWTAFPNTRPVGEKRAAVHYRELQALMASGISEAQLFRATELLAGDQFSRCWVSDLESMAKNWPKIAGKLNGALHKPEGKTSVFNLKTVIKAKQDKADEIKRKFSSEVAMGTIWEDEAAKSRYVGLKREIRQLNNQLAEAL